MVWHGDDAVPSSDLIVLPGGFSYGDYLRCGAMAAHSPIMRDVIAKAKAGTPVLGICNGFQVLCESGLLAGRADAQRVASSSSAATCYLKVENDKTFYTQCYRKDQVIRMPVAHGDGNYFADEATLDRLEGEGQVVFRYCDAAGEVSPETSPNGAQRNIAGICDPTGRILGLMPHPERMYETGARRRGRAARVRERARLGHCRNGVSVCGAGPAGDPAKRKERAEARSPRS